MKRITTTLLFAVAAWCAFWWGYTIGMRSATSTDLDSAKTDLALQEAMLTENPDKPISDIHQTLNRLREDRLNELMQRVDVSAGEFLLAPITAPVGALALEAVRAGNSEN